VAGRFPLLTDENVKGPVIDGLRHHGWNVKRVVDIFGETSIDEVIFGYAVEHDLVLASSDTDCLVIGRRWLDDGRLFRLAYWPQGPHQQTSVARFLAAFDALAAKENAFTACIEYLAL
jgi:hypothetical protein